MHSLIFSLSVAPVLLAAPGAGSVPGFPSEPSDQHAAEHRAMEERLEQRKRTVGQDAEAHETFMRHIEALGNRRPHQRD